MKLDIVITAVVALGLKGAVSYACSCSGAVVSSPRDSEADVSQDAAIFVQAPDVDLASVSLVGNGNLSVPIRVEDHAGWLLVNHDTGLAANTGYVLSFNTPAGVKTVRFTTGATLTTSPGAYAGLASVAFERLRYPVTSTGSASCVNSCVVTDTDGNATRVRIASEALPAGTTWLSLQLSDAATHAVIGETAIRSPWTTAFTLGFDACGDHAPSFARHASLCATLIAYTTDGSAIGAPATVCSPVVDCAVTVDASCSPTDQCGAESAVPPASSGCSIGGGGKGLGLLVILAVAFGFRPGRSRS